MDFTIVLVNNTLNPRVGKNNTDFEWLPIYVLIEIFMARFVNFFLLKSFLFFFFIFDECRANIT